MEEGNNNFLSICDPKREYEFNNVCYEKCPEGSKLDETVKTKNICICNNLNYLIIYNMKNNLPKEEILIFISLSII